MWLHRVTCPNTLRCSEEKRKMLKERSHRHISSLQTYPEIQICKKKQRRQNWQQKIVRAHNFAEIFQFRAAVNHLLIFQLSFMILQTSVFIGILNTASSQASENLSWNYLDCHQMAPVDFLCLFAAFYRVQNVFQSKQHSSMKKKILILRVVTIKMQMRHLSPFSNYIPSFLFCIMFLQRMILFHLSVRDHIPSTLINYNKSTFFK